MAFRISPDDPDYGRSRHPRFLLLDDGVRERTGDDLVARSLGGLLGCAGNWCLLGTSPRQPSPAYHCPGATRGRSI